MDANNSGVTPTGRVAVKGVRAGAGVLGGGGVPGGLGVGGGPGILPGGTGVVFMLKIWAELPL